MLKGQFSYTDEYDSYLLTSAGMAANGRSPEDIAHYPGKVETERLGAAPWARRKIAPKRWLGWQGRFNV